MKDQSPAALYAEATRKQRLEAWIKQLQEKLQSLEAK